MHELTRFCEENGWKIVKRIETPGREQELGDYSQLGVANRTLHYLKQSVPGGLYLHQIEAVRCFMNGGNVCLSTGTASGKSLPFYIGGIETLVRNPRSRILAIYPIKALGVEQEARWRKALEQAQLDVRVGRIDGEVPTAQRKRILKESRVVILTPDVMHAWLLSNLSDRLCVDFLRSVELLIVDEVHIYTGVFGSNSAFLFRRLRHLMAFCGRSPQFICASATISDPADHLQKLFGVPFSIIDSRFDTSPKHGVEIIMVDPPKQVDSLAEVARFLHFVGNQYGRFIGFVDSRKQTELLANILSRSQGQEEEDETSVTTNLNQLDSLQILPYRAGYEEYDRTAIQERLSSGRLKGIVSTSALELGLDIPHLDVAILVGVPYSATSFFQRIGRIGRHKKGMVFVINTGGFYDEMVFQHPERLLDRPLIQSTLYLENQRVQYIHALCLARPGGEHDQLLASMGKHQEDNDSFTSPIDWPQGFLELCHSERIGEIPPELQVMKAEAGEDPNHIYPLRDVESQFKVLLKQGPEQRELGSLSFSQVLREAYPGAVYYYTANTYRVYRVNPQSKVIETRREKRYTTQPIRIPTLVFPNMADGNVYLARRHGQLTIFESNLQIRESLSGFKEHRGPAEYTFTYPLQGIATAVYYDKPRFTRNYFTSGVVLTHPDFNDHKIELENVARLLYEAFLITLPFERQDLDFAVDKHRSSKAGFFAEGERFIAIFDKTYGSLRLSGRVMQANLMQRVFQQAIEIAGLDETIEITTGLLDLLARLKEESQEPGTPIHFAANPVLEACESLEKIILPESVGMAIHNGNQEYLVQNIFFNPKQGLCYRGRYVMQRETDTTVIILPVHCVIEIPGESEIGYYNYESGEIERR